jgi:hypothetical protein
MTRPPRVKTGIGCFLLATLAGFRVLTQGMWNLEHTGEGFLGYEPMTQLLTLAIAVIAAIAGVYVIVRGRAPRDKRPRARDPLDGRPPMN